MVYRAKITSIVSFIESNLNLNRFPIMKDLKDIYVEVESEELAECIEKLNKIVNETNMLKIRFYNLINEVI